MLQNFQESFFQYFGGVRAVLPVAAAVICLILGRKKIRYAGSILALLGGFIALFINPAAQLLWRKFIEQPVYWRTYWLLPIVPVTAYALTEIIWMQEGRMRIAAIAAGSAVVLAGGDNMYRPQDGYFSKAANVYKLPETSCKVAEYIVDQTGGTLALVPDSLYCYLRQYSAKIDLVYGRNIDGFTSPVLSKSLHKLHGLMWNPPYKIRKILKRAKKRNCEIVVFHSDWEKIGDPEDYGYTLLTEIGNYEIYQQKDQEKE